MDEYMKMKMDLEGQDVNCVRSQCDPGIAIRLLYANAHKRLERLLEPHLDAVKNAADTYIKLGLYDDEGNEKLYNIQSAESIGYLLSQMSTRSTWDSTRFLQQAVDAIPAMAIEREIAEAILAHYNLHLVIYKRATLLKDDLAKENEAKSDAERKGAMASKNLIAFELTSSKSFAEFTCEDCHRLQVHILSQVYGIAEKDIVCLDAVEDKSTTVTFLIPNRFTYIIMQRTTELETVWTLLELSIIEVAISGFTFKPTMGSFLTLLRGRQPFPDLLGATQVKLQEMKWACIDACTISMGCHAQELRVS